MEIKKLYIEHASLMQKIWNRSFEDKYAMDKETIIEKTFNDGEYFENGSLGLMDENNLSGYIVTKINRGTLPEYNNCAWLSTLVVDREYRNNGYGKALYNAAEDALKKAGIKKIILGGDMDNFFSGIPEPTPCADQFFKDLGYTLNPDKHYDLTADVSKIDFDALDVRLNNDDRYHTEILNKDGVDGLTVFFDKNFPGRWKFEIMNYINGGGDLKDIMLLMDGHKAAGFCKVFKNEDEAAAHREFGVNWGSLGPIGVDEDLRGRYLGNRLLNDSLKYLKIRGCGNVIIDWTILRDYYGQFGFKPYKTYRGGIKFI